MYFFSPISAESVSMIWRTDALDWVNEIRKHLESFTANPHSRPRTRCVSVPICCRHKLNAVQRKLLSTPPVQTEPGSPVCTGSKPPGSILTTKCTKKGSASEECVGWTKEPWLDWTATASHHFIRVIAMVVHAVLHQFLLVQVSGTTERTHECWPVRDIAAATKNTFTHYHQSLTPCALHVSL